jgi:hypothetical protein
MASFDQNLNYLNPGSGYVSGSALTKNAGSGSALKPSRIRNTGFYENHIFTCSFRGGLFM